MSYSTCILCKSMVFSYEALCLDCLKKYNLEQSNDYHKKPLEFQDEYKKKIGLGDNGKWIKDYKLKKR